MTRGSTSMVDRAGRVDFQCYFSGGFMRNSGQFKPSGQEPRRGIGGARPGAGRKSKQAIADEARASEIARQMLAKSIGEVIDLAKKLCKGVKVRKFYPANHKKAGQQYYDIEYDSAMIRFWIERFVPAARQGIDVNINSPDERFRFIEAAKRAKAERLANEKAIEAKAIPQPEVIPEPEDGKVH